MAKDKKFFNCSQKHEIDYLASKFVEPREIVIEKIIELCKAKKIHYSTHQEAETALINSGFTKKNK
ncbi:MAG: hypothetical protein ACVCEJ_05245 [Candidatus Izemoplasmataceae bacterium]